MRPAWDEEPCVVYDGCDEGLPLVWCQTSGSGHGRQDGFSDLVFWTFFESL